MYLKIDEGILQDLREEYQRRCKYYIKYTKLHKDNPTNNFYKKCYYEQYSKVKEFWELMDILEVPERLYK